MLDIIPSVGEYLDVPEASTEKLFGELVAFQVSAEVVERYDRIRTYEREGMDQSEIAQRLREGGMDQQRVDDILREYRSVRRVLYRHRGKQRFLRGVPILLLGLAGFAAVYLGRNTLRPVTLGCIAIASFVTVVIALDATFGGLLQMVTGWN